jgi:exosortase O
MTRAIATVYQNSSLPLLQMIAVFGAFWPVWQWYCERLFDRSDEPLGIVALITLLALGGWRYHSPDASRQSYNWLSSATQESRRTTITVSALILSYCIVVPFAPPIVSALFATGVLGIFLSHSAMRHRTTAGDFALLFLSLPMVASLNFYGGYPLRMLACQLASAMLNLGGLAVTAQGTEILSNNSIVGIDPPCSGIKMLWVALYLTATFASIRSLKPLPTIKLLVMSLLAAILANALRISSLFYVESGVIDVGGVWHSVVHSGVGVAVFALSAAALMKLTYSLPESDRVQPKAKPSEQDFVGSVKHIRVLVFCFLASCVLAAAMPLLHSQKTVAAPASQSVDWPTQFEGQQLKQVALSEVTERFAQEFPGQIAVFTTGKRRFVYRWVTQATRQLHPASTCYKASGYEIKWLPEYVDESNNKWSAFEATKGSEKLLVRERLYDAQGHNWTDVSSWYWSAVLKQSISPWWSVSVAERIQ